MKGIKGWISDLGFALRVMARKPQASLMLIATLVLGISVTTAMFSVLDAVLLRPLPFVEPNRVVVLGGAGFNDFEYWNGAHTFEHIAGPFGWREPRRPRNSEQDASCRSFTDFFAVFSVQPLAGNIFEENDRLPGRNHIAILSHRFWQHNFSSNSSALGAAIRINGEDYVVTGIMPAGLSVPGDTALWVPKPRGSPTLDLISGEQIDLPYYMSQRVVGRLRQGVTLDQARRELEDLRLALAKKLAGTRFAVTSQVNVSPYQQRLISNFRPGLLLLFRRRNGVDDCVRKRGRISFRARSYAAQRNCSANIAGSEPMADRSSTARRNLCDCLGQQRRCNRVIRYPNSSHSHFRSGGNAAPVGSESESACARVRAGHFTNHGNPRRPVARIALLQRANSLPSLQSAGPRSGGQFSSRSRRVLIVAEIAAAMTLTCTAGIAMRSLHKLMSVDVGFAREHVLTMRLAPPVPPPIKSATAKPADTRQRH